MNYILKAITDHPEAFKQKLGNDTSTDELLQIVYSANNIGTSIQQKLVTITKLYFGWTILVKLGLRSIAMPMGIQLLENFNWNHHYQYAADICNQLMIHYYMLGNGGEAEKYKRMFKEYNDIYSLEAEMESLYCRIIYKNDHGIELDKKAIIKDLKVLKSRLKFDSWRYHYYYFQCQCIINQGEEYEKWCLLGLDYFKKLYFKHEIYTNIFIKCLYTYYLTIEEYDKVKIQIRDIINETIEGSQSWFRFKYIYIIALLNSTEFVKAQKEMTFCKSLKTFHNLSEAHQEEWQYLADTIKSKNHFKITSKQKK